MAGLHAWTAIFASHFVAASRLGLTHDTGRNTRTHRGQIDMGRAPREVTVGLDSGGAILVFPVRPFLPLR